MNETQLQVIYGSLLGDGGLDKPLHANSRLQIRHSERQLYYILYKDYLLKPLSLGVFEIRWFDKRTNKLYRAYGMNTIRSKFFTELYNVFYVNGKKIVPRLIVEEANEIALAILIGDDSTFDKNSRTVKISVDAYDYQSRQRMVAWLYRKFDIEATIQKDRVYILRRHYPRLVELVRDYLPTQLWYKLGIRPY